VMEPVSQILIVEDSETQALQLRYLLEEEGWGVVRAATAESALDQLNRRLPALIIADYHLPGMRGDELCRKVRMNVATRGIPILMLTAEEASGIEPAGLDSGADDYVSKSAGPDILLVRVRALLRSSTAGLSSILSPQEAYFRRARILAIDDSPTYLESLAEAFGSEGYDVTKAADGKEGLERIAHEPFDCVMVDLIMPEMDGIEVCRRINEMGRSMDQPMVVIMLTSSDSKEDMTRGLEAGADDFVGKSNDTAVLKARIRALLRRKFFQEENRRIREQLQRTEMEATEARAARRLSETRAVLVEELERKNRELEAFSYSVSHDLRAPLRSIDGFSKALLEDYADKLDANGQRYLDRVRAAAQRMGELIDDLLELSKVGRAALQRRPVDLSVLARKVAAELQNATPARRVQVLIPDGMVADADQRLLRVVLENLLGNAWKFTTTVVEAIIELGVSQRDGVSTYFVRDNGAGFDMAHAGKLFTPFQRLHPESKFPGTGIGLATVHRIVDRHGGRVWAESAVERGATFLWTLPAQTAGSHDTKRPHHPACGRQRRRCRAHRAGVQKEQHRQRDRCRQRRPKSPRLSFHCGRLCRPGSHSHASRGPVGPQAAWNRWSRSAAAHSVG
jgi:two-component system NtrC family sensor kinase